ncbi:MAG: phosphatidate cytidylyltransferase, partial [Actinocatenispora sp.]
GQTAEQPAVRDRSAEPPTGPWPGPAGPPSTGQGPNEPPPGAVPPPGGVPAPTVPVSGGRAGRNLPAAIGVGVGLGAVVLASLFIWRPAFLIVLIAGVVLGTWEMVRALGRATEPAKRARPPLVPLVVGALAMEVLAWFGGLEALTVGLVFTVAAVLIWRLADGPAGYRRDVAAATLVACYVPFLAGFGVLLARPEDGAWRVVLALAMVVCSDTGGYAVGVFLGKHRMAPVISPGKSWEGFAGSVAVSALAGALILLLGFDRPWWYGVVFGVAVSLASVLGDLAESLLKRDLGLKDMGHLLPGHGGVMDRLDSILLAVPVAFALLSVLLPSGG